ncbi:hypothetical protein J2X36_005056 [Methylobacterium sp. BE186]|nr:hypothetical protein [Methylobacterium sp. BE186]
MAEHPEPGRTAYEARFAGQKLGPRGVASARADLEDVSHPDYEDTADATSARLPIHPGSIDYYEREQETFIERYESWIYLVAILAGGLGSTGAWLRRRIGRVRRERIEVSTARLLEHRSKARRETDRDRLEAMAGEVDDLVGGIARHALNRPTETRTKGAGNVAIEAARSTVKRALSHSSMPAR